VLQVQALAHILIGEPASTSPGYALADRASAACRCDKKVPIVPAKAATIRGATKTTETPPVPPIRDAVAVRAP